MKNYKDNLVSLITPGWRGKEFVHRLLDSILAQTYRPIEYFYVDDCSGDGTIDIVRGYAKKFRDAHIDFQVIERQENGGLSETIMEGLQKIHGEFFSCPEYDDILFPTSVEKRVDYLRNNSQCAVVTADAWVVSESNLEKKVQLISRNNPNRFDKNHFNASLVTQSIYNSACIMIRTEMFDKTHPDRRFFSSRMGINQQVLLPLYYHYERGFISEPQSLFVQREESVSHSCNKTLQERLTKLKEYHHIIFSTLDSINMPDEERDVYKKTVDTNFHKDYIQLGFEYNDGSMFFDSYSYLKNEGELPVDADEKYAIISSPFKYWFSVTCAKRYSSFISKLKTEIYKFLLLFKKVLLYIWDCGWIITAFLTDLFFYLKDIIIRKLRPSPNVLSLEETLLYINEHHCSVARYGDGEMKFIIGAETWFQPTDPVLKQRLTEILYAPNANLQVCIPGIFGSLKMYAPEFRNYWQKYISRHRLQWYRHIDRNQTYGEAFISRCYLPYKDRSHAKEYFSLWKEIWKGRDLLIVEGAKTRLGVGNDLFDNVNSVNRILAPNTNAFAHYSELLAEVKKFDKEHLILLALGPTATVLAADLCQIGYQAIDIGHIDIEYEWMRMGVDHKVPVDNKFVNEAGAGKGVGESLDKKYLSEIVKILE